MMAVKYNRRIEGIEGIEDIENLLNLKVNILIFE